MSETVPLPCWIDCSTIRGACQGANTGNIGRFRSLAPASSGPDLPSAPLEGSGMVVLYSRKLLVCSLIIQVSVQMSDCYQKSG